MRDQIEKALYIARKDIRVHYLKAPNFTYGLLMPLALYLAFGASGNLSATTLISGLISLVVLFGATSIEAVVVVSERTTGTFERLLVAPVTLRWILFGARAKVQYARYFKGEIGEPTHSARINDRARAKIRSEYVVAG